MGRRGALNITRRGYRGPGQGKHKQAIPSGRKMCWSSRALYLSALRYTQLMNNDLAKLREDHPAWNFGSRLVAARRNSRSATSWAGRRPLGYTGLPRRRALVRLDRRRTQPRNQQESSGRRRPPEGRSWPRRGALEHASGQHRAGHRLGHRADLEPAIQRAVVAELDRVPALVSGHRREERPAGKLRAQSAGQLLNGGSPPAHASATKVPIGLVTTRPSSRRATITFCAVVMATPYSWLMEAIEGTRSIRPGFRDRSKRYHP